MADNQAGYHTPLSDGDKMNEKKQNPTSFFKKRGFDVHSIAASFSNRALTRLDVIRYQLAVIGC